MCSQFFHYLSGVLGCVYQTFADVATVTTKSGKSIQKATITIADTQLNKVCLRYDQ
jgi:hypothetical protein